MTEPSGHTATPDSDALLVLNGGEAGLGKTALADLAEARAIAAPLGAKPALAPAAALAARLEAAP